MVDKSLMKLHVSECWDKFVEKTDRRKYFDKDGNKEEARSVEEANNVNGYFGDQDDRPHEKH